MCGIVGKINFRGSVDDTLIERMCACIEHRGPDSRGVYTAPGVALGIQRLAIIDVAGGDQPIFSEDKSVVVVMNGEIYNHVALRDQLAGKGHHFSSHADTEVLVHLYEEYGERMVEHLRGMFAFAIWDTKNRRLLLARDRIGKKPLFWATSGATTWFASELRALLEDPELPRRVDIRAVSSYLALQYVPDPLSILVGVNKLEPATTLSVTAEGAEARKYWRLDYSKKTAVRSETEAADELRDRIWEATKVRLMSEVPLGAFLSGGLDSSAVVAAMAAQTSGRVKTFSIGFKDAAFDELQYARIVADQFGTDHHEFIVEPDSLAIMPQLARQYGEPFADPSAIPSFYLSEMTSRHVTVALNGDGGDESFGGYQRYETYGNAGHLDWVPRPLQLVAPHVAALLPPGAAPTSLGARARRLAGTLAMSQSERYARWMSAFDGFARERLFTDEAHELLGGWRAEAPIIDAWESSSATSRIDRLLDVDVQTYLPGDLLVKMDIASMAHSLEARSPFLDHELMEFAAALPASQKRAGADGKRILKLALRDVLPPEILSRPKMGFGVPLGRWFREDLSDLPEEVLLDARTVQRGYFRREEVLHLISEHRSGRTDHSWRLWTLLQLEMWFREVFDAVTSRHPSSTHRTGQSPSNGS